MVMCHEVRTKQTQVGDGVLVGKTKEWSLTITVKEPKIVETIHIW